MKEQQNKANDINVANNKIEDGFSSQEEPEQEIVYSASQQVDDFLHLNNQDIKIKLQELESRQVISIRYSLQPDMINGWTPKTPLPKPIPLTFYNYQFDQLVDSTLNKLKSYTLKKQLQQKLQICYLGPRYESTYYAWYDKQFQFPYKYLNAPKNISITDRPFVGQHWDAQKPNILQFDSIFQSGNLDCAVKVGQTQYDLFIRVDTNTKGHLQWYNFKVKNLQVGKLYKMNICNFQKGKNLYMRGMRPYCFSSKKYENQSIGWHQIESQIKYRKKISKFEKITQFEGSQKFYQLSFEISTKYENEVIQLAYCIPYTYSRMKNYLKDLQNDNRNRNILTFKKLCSSLGGIPIDELTITENADQEQKSFKNNIKLNKKIIFVTGRCHPGETNGSWMVEGLIDFLCGVTETAYFLRKNMIFKIIPMLNPDGVVIGNYRTGLFGKDFNRQFHSPDKDVFPEVYNLKQMFWSYKKIYQESALVYLDFHGHSVKKNVFAYGPQYPISHKNYYESRMIAKFISLKSKMFRYYSCVFKISESKQSTGRAIFLKSHKIPFTFTIQASNGAYFDQDQGIDCDFNEHRWKEVGSKVIEGISEYMGILIQMQKIRIQKIKQRKQMLMKNREKAKLKKNLKNNKFGCFTSMGFRKCRTMNNQQLETTEQYQHDNIDFLIGVESLENNEAVSELLKQIKKEDSDNKEKKKSKNQEEGQGKYYKKLSDDQISEGKSDSEASKDDLDLDIQNQIYGFIKKKKIKGKINLSKLSIQRKPDSAQKIEEAKGEEQDDKILKNLKANPKQIIIRKYMYKKKNSIFTTQSPKKQQFNPNSTAAKIVNFNFSLNPVECTLQQSIGFGINNIQPSQNGMNSNYYSTKQSSNRLNNRVQSQKMSQKNYEYSQNFKRTFMSVQKQIIRRDSHKRYLVSLNNSHSKNRNCLLENVKGKRIGHTPQQRKKTKDQYSQFYSQKSIESKSASPDINMKHHRGYKNVKITVKKPQSEIVLIESQKYDKQF